MFNKKKTETDLLYSEISRLKKQNKKIMLENKLLHEMASEFEGYQQQYQSALKEIAQIKTRYLTNIKQFENMQRLFAAEYQSFMKQL